ncbi:MAG: hypothetical protein PVF57_10240 [Pseudomonadales bacterium]|jgi:hypothetical protein
MIDPVDVRQIALAAIIAGSVIFFGAAYAVFYALGRLTRRRPFLVYAHAFYAALVLATIGLAGVLHLSGIWLLLVVLLLAGYLVAPRFIWRLSTEVHSLAEQDPEPSVDDKREPVGSLLEAKR